MIQRGESIRVMHPLFHEGEGGSIPTSPLQLRFGQITLSVAKGLNAHWHSRLPRYTQTQCLACYGAEFGGKFYAAAIWSNPSSAMLPQDWIELKRMAISDDAPKNTASRMLAWMVRDMRRKFPMCPRFISYQDPVVHSGTIYRAAGWANAGSRKSGGFASTTRRFREADQAPGPKVRWELAL